MNSPAVIGRDNGVIRNALGLSHQYALAALRAGDRAVDATAGNGGDTLFLAEAVGAGGHVDAFDIQPQAIASTRRRLEVAGLAARCTLHLSSHDRLADHIESGVRVIMFNLGYLPGGDHRVGTRAETTLAALEQSMFLLQPGGIITLAIYYGGDSGYVERDAVLDFLRGIDVRRFAVQQIEMVNAANCPPIFACIEKLRH